MTICDEIWWKAPRPPADLGRRSVSDKGAARRGKYAALNTQNDSTRFRESEEIDSTFALPGFSLAKLLGPEIILVRGLLNLVPAVA